MKDIELAVLTDVVREIKAAIEQTPIENQTRNDKKIVILSDDVWSHICELIYQIEKMNNYNI